MATVRAGERTSRTIQNVTRHSRHNSDVSRSRTRTSWHPDASGALPPTVVLASDIRRSPSVGPPSRPGPPDAERRCGAPVRPTKWSDIRSTGGVVARTTPSHTSTQLGETSDTIAAHSTTDAHAAAIKHHHAPSSTPLARSLPPSAVGSGWVRPSVNADTVPAIATANSSGATIAITRVIPHVGIARSSAPTPHHATPRSHLDQLIGAPVSLIIVIARCGSVPRCVPP